MRPGHAITSYCVFNGLGDNTNEVVDALFRGRTAVRLQTAFPGRSVYPIELPLSRVAPSATGQWEMPTTTETPFVTRQARLTTTGLEEIVHDARAAVSRYGADRVAVILGTSTGGIEGSERALAMFLKSGQLPVGFACTEHHSLDSAARAIAKAVGVRGPTYAVSTACSSSAKALASASRLLRASVVDAVLVAGIDSLCMTTLLGFRGLGVTDPKGCRPFARDRAGMNVGEGAAFLLLEREAEGDVYLVSAGESGDAHHMAQPHPRGDGAERAIRGALDTAGIEPSRIGYVNAHGTGTFANDQAESLVLARVFGRNARVSSTKSATGHLLGASGATEAVFCLEALRHQTVPGNGPFDYDDLGIDVAPRTAQHHFDFALSNSFAFGGSNASLLLATAQGRASLDTIERSCLPETFSVVDAVALMAEPEDTNALSPSLLSPRTLGRASALTKLFAEALSRLAQRGADVATTPAVFASAFGEMQTTLRLLELQALKGESSPLRFQVSVHNAAQGLLSIATGHRGFQTTLSAGSRTFGMALIEALTLLSTKQSEDVIIVVAEEPAPTPLSRSDYEGMSAGFVFRRGRVAGKPTIDFPHRAACPAQGLLRTRIDEKWRSNPLADALHLVAAFEGDRSGIVPLESGADGAGSGPRWLLNYSAAAS